MDVSFLQLIFAATGPFATVCADVTPMTENADAELDPRVRAISEKLTQRGAPDTEAEGVRGRLLEGNDGGESGTLRGRALAVSDDGSVVLDQALVDGPPREIAEWSPSGRRSRTSRPSCGSCPAGSRTSSPTAWAPTSRTSVPPARSTR